MQTVGIAGSEPFSAGLVCPDVRFDGFSDSAFWSLTRIVWFPSHVSGSTTPAFWMVLSPTQKLIDSPS